MLLSSIADCLIGFPTPRFFNKPDQEYQYEYKFRTLRHIDTSLYAKCILNIFLNIVLK